MSPSRATRVEAVDAIVTSLPRRSAQLVRLVHRQAASSIPRGMSTLLTALDDHPQQITQLAEREGLAQPTVTRMISRLEKLGLVARERHPEDGRVVVVTITAKGKHELVALRARFAAVLRDSLGGLSDGELSDLQRGSDALGRLIELLREGPSRPTPDR